MLKPGDMGFLMHHDNLISKVIAWFMGSKWSHTFLILGDGTARIYTVETSDYEVVVHLLDGIMKDKNVSMEIYRCDSIGDQERELICNEALKTLGTTYGYLQLISLGLRCILRRLFKLKINNFFRQGVVCCGVALYGYTKSSIEGLKGIDPESIDTEELYQLVCSIKNEQGKIFRKVAYKDVGKLDTNFSL